NSVTVIEGQVPYTFTSDATKKENFQRVDGEDVLRKISGLNVTSWNYIGHDPRQFRHYGPVAQEFFAAFGHDAMGTIGTDTTINSGDLEGILTIGVQALEQRTRAVQALRAENADLSKKIDAMKAENTDLNKEISSLKARLEALERLLANLKGAADQ
ncbi:MAG TPA: tail fiber domain-containing protein, partial [Blastocatellia bacterium]